jgi:hypothetical protein
MIVVENHSFKHPMVHYTIMSRTWQSTARSSARRKFIWIATAQNLELSPSICP